MGQPVKIIDLAERMIRLSGLEPGRDIEIKFIGIRPGERLHEILFAREEPTAPIGIEGIVAARPVSPSLEAMRGWLAALEQGLARGERSAIYGILRDAVPDFGGRRPEPLRRDPARIGDRPPAGRQKLGRIDDGVSRQTLPQMSASESLERSGQQERRHRQQSRPAVLAGAQGTNDLGHRQRRGVGHDIGLIQCGGYREHKMNGGDQIVASQEESGDCAWRRRATAKASRATRIRLARLPLTPGP